MTRNMGDVVANSFSWKREIDRAERKGWSVSYDADAVVLRKHGKAYKFKRVQTLREFLFVH